MPNRTFAYSNFVLLRLKFKYSLAEIPSNKTFGFSKWCKTGIFFKKEWLDLGPCTSVKRGITMWEAREAFHIKKVECSLS